MIRKIKKVHVLRFFLILMACVFAFGAWLIFELTANDIKGKENLGKKMYYQVMRVVNPIEPAVHLAVPYHHQERTLSCEVAALKMALNYRGIEVTENELIEQLPIADPGPRRAGNIWGDPNVGFVGNIDGTMPNIGYGVYEQPIYDLASKYRNAKIITDATLKDLIAELTDGNPIVVWGVKLGTNKDISWKTPEGKQIDAYLDEHARTLIGYTGTSADPKLMILLDPVYGEIRLSIEKFIKDWAVLDNKAVVVY
jgi:uncharacterized protein YvpB